MSSETILNGRYRLVAQQGSGGMAVIYRAIDQMLGRQVAVKILRPSLTSDPSFLARFRNEARSVANLQHPNIVTVYDVGQDGPTHYIVMEFVDGNDLKKIIKADGALPIGRALKLAIQLCAGIGFAHRAGLVHADVKPQNILVTNEDVVKVTDFGIAQAMSSAPQGERQTVVWGSPHYFAPEQARGERPSPAADVYSIGIVLFELLTGRLPYSGQNQQELALAHIRDPIPLVSAFNPTVPDSLVRIVAKTMSKEPEQRYRMADQLKGILEGFLGRGGIDLLATPPPPQGSSAPTIAAGGAAQPSGGTSQGAPARGVSGTAPNIPLPPYSTNANTPGAPQVTGRTPPPPGSTPLPQGVVPLASTQRVDLAPNAPSVPPGYGARPGVGTNPSYGAPPPTATPTFASGGTGAFNTGSSQRVPAQAARPLLDGVTILLALLAFMAIACLIPLYIVVFQARFAG
ncbi:MAG: protein kinase [Chloroflexota bacterium]|nr:protein kinase [Chloroflexota bacterium]